MILLDVDYTLYPKGSGPFKEVSKRIDGYVMSLLSLGLEDARTLRREYIIKYGSTLGGLIHDYGVDPSEFLRYVHDVPVEKLLKPDKRLKDVLSSIPYDLVVFSNASLDYVRRVLLHLGIADLFCGMFTIESMDFIPKPREYPYYKIMDMYRMKPGYFVMVDDREENVSTAIDMGMEGILVGSSKTLKGALPINDIYGITDAIGR